MGFEYIIEDDHEAMSQRAAGFIERHISDKPRSHLCLATGSTPIRTYELLAQQAESNSSLFKEVRLAKLDEWLGLPMDHQSTCEKYLREKVLNPLGIAENRFYGFNSNPDDPGAECRRIEQRFEKEGRLDLCVLGVGTNGHLGFNEPGEWLVPGPHIAKLTEQSRKHVMLAGAEEEVSKGLTLGLRNILSAHTVLLLVSGKHKLPVMNQFQKRQITTRLPVSLLWTHPNVTCIGDLAAINGDRL